MVTFGMAAGWKARGFKSLDEQFSPARASFWIKKIRGNVARDERVNAELLKLGWKVIRLWESDVRRSPERCAERIHLTIKRRTRR